MNRSRSLKDGRYGTSSARTGASHYIGAVNGSNRNRGPDFGLDNFAFDPEYLQEWRMPDIIGQNLPESLRTDVTNWEHAGAAVCTSLARITRLYSTAASRLRPVVSHPHLMGRRRSEQSPTVRPAVYLDTPSCSTPDSTSSNGHIIPLSLEKIQQLTAPFNTQQTQLGMESPPFTPYDTRTCTTPVIPGATTITSPSAIGAQHITAQFSPPPSSRSSCRSSMVLETSPKLGIESEDIDETAWETFLGACTAERFDLRQNVLSRFVGFTRIIDRTLLELANDCTLGEDEREALRLFYQWWQGRKSVIAAYEIKIRSVEVPKLEDILWRIEEDLK